MCDIIRFLGLTFISISLFTDSYLIGATYTIAVIIGGLHLAYENRSTPSAAGSK